MLSLLLAVVFVVAMAVPVAAAPEVIDVEQQNVDQRNNAVTQINLVTVRPLNANFQPIANLPSRNYHVNMTSTITYAWLEVPRTWANDPNIHAFQVTVQFHWGRANRGGTGWQGTTSRSAWSNWGPVPTNSHASFIFNFTRDSLIRQQDPNFSIVSNALDDQEFWVYFFPQW